MVNPAGIKFKVNCVKSVQKKKKKKKKKNRHQTADMSLTSVWCLYFWFWVDFTHFPGVSIDDLEKANSVWELTDISRASVRFNFLKMIRDFSLGK